MKMYSAVTADSLPLAEVDTATGEVRVFPEGTAVAAFLAGSDHWHIVTKAEGLVFSGACRAQQLEFRDAITLGGAA